MISSSTLLATYRQPSCSPPLIPSRLEHLANGRMRDKLQSHPSLAAEITGSGRVRLGLCTQVWSNERIEPRVYVTTQARLSAIS